MQGSDSKRSAAYLARGFIILGAALELGLSALPAAAAPFAYVSSSTFLSCSGGVSVVDTGAKPPAVVATVGVGQCPDGVAVTPDGNTSMSRMKNPALPR
jgi:DNA-binding beta-propeller fold protein YncE